MKGDWGKVVEERAKWNSWKHPLTDTCIIDCTVFVSNYLRKKTLTEKLWWRARSHVGFSALVFLFSLSWVYLGLIWLKSARLGCHLAILKRMLLAESGGYYSLVKFGWKKSDLYTHLLATGSTYLYWVLRMCYFASELRASLNMPSKFAPLNHLENLYAEMSRSIVLVVVYFR